ncbi:hypothetical protein [Paenibacillus sonchi]|nr:hypothetical protein [Paenibacillus sonchi]
MHTARGGFSFPFGAGPDVMDAGGQARREECHLMNTFSSRSTIR